MVEKINLLQKYVSLQYPTSIVSNYCTKKESYKTLPVVFKPHPENWTGHGSENEHF